MPRINMLDWIVLFIVILGAFNWGLVGLLDMNLINQLLSDYPQVKRTVYIVEGLSSFYMLFFAFKLAA